MPKYRRRTDNDIWHWCTNCSNWPTAGYEEQYVAGGRPESGKLDNECLAKERDGTCGANE